MTAKRLLARLPVPRLLPATIMVMAALLVVKSTSLVRIASAGAAPENVNKPTAASQTEGERIASAQAEAARAEAARNASAGANQDVKATASSAPASAPIPQPAAPMVTDSERALLTDLRARRAALDQRESGLAAREATVAALEQRVGARVAELNDLQHRLEALETQRRERDEQNWRGLVKLYESMKPRDAAIIFNDLDMPVLLPVLDRMKEAKAAPILAAMAPDRARQVTAELAQSRTKANSIDNQPAAPGRTGG